VQLNAEIKPCIGRERETGAAVALETQALFSAPEHVALKPLLSSFSTDALIAARDAAPEFDRAHLFENPLPADWLARCKAVGAMAMNANWRTLTPEIVAFAHANGLRVACYTCNDLADAERLWTWGVDSVITDAVDRIAFCA
jgi:glycerophosphoryl diester phosphodiesterase